MTPRMPAAVTKGSPGPARALSSQSERAGRRATRPNKAKLHAWAIVPVSLLKQQRRVKTAQQGGP